MVIERVFITFDVRCFDYAYKWYVGIHFSALSRRVLVLSLLRKSSVNSPTEKVPSRDEFQIHKLSSVVSSNISSS